MYTPSGRFEMTKNKNVGMENGYLSQRELPASRLRDFDEKRFFPFFCEISPLLGAVAALWVFPFL